MRIYEGPEPKDRFEIIAVQAATRKVAARVNTSAFVGTNQKGEPITSGLPVIRPA
jgi:hypothetical protein